MARRMVYVALMTIAKRKKTPWTVATSEQIWDKHSEYVRTRDIEGVLGTLSEDCRYEIVNSPYFWQGHEGVRAFYQELNRAIPDLELETLEASHGTHGAFEKLRLTGTHEGFFRDYAPSLRVIDTTLATFLPFDPDSGLFRGKEFYLNLSDLFCGLSRIGSLEDAKSIPATEK